MTTPEAGPFTEAEHLALEMARKAWPVAKGTRGDDVVHRDVAVMTERIIARPEREIQRACLDWLAARHIPSWRANTGAFRGTYQGKDRFVRFGVKGQADILGLLPPSGRLLAVEVKRPGGKLSPHQDAFLQSIVRAGGIGLVVTSPAELRDKLARYLEVPA